MADEAILRLASELAASLAKSWKEGRKRTAEEILAEHAQLQDHPEAFLRVIYEEICVHEPAEQPAAVADLCQRFPKLKNEILALWECHRMVNEDPIRVSYPEPGDLLGDFSILAELGQGANGRVYLADQPYLAGRTVVLKVTPCKGSEHFNLARLQHSHIVPLLWVQEISERSLRILCMPYLGGTTLEEVLHRLRSIPIAERRGAQFIDVVAAIEKERVVPSTNAGSGRLFLRKATYSDALCWIGICLADALHYAHEQGLVHFDVRPSNVLISSDGRPMLLDFHLARHPIVASNETPQWLGGTPRYMSPEQYNAWTAIRDGKPITQPVDARSDIYSLAASLVECFCECPAAELADKTPSELLRESRHLPPGLRDILGRCLSFQPESRYPTAAALADDLRRQLNHLPLVGVRNRSLFERWRKWRSRRPHALFGISSVAVVMVTAAALSLVQWREWQSRWEAASTFLVNGQDQIDSGKYGDAMTTFRKGLEQLQGVPFQAKLREEFSRSLTRARVGSTLKQLHVLVERLRFLHAHESLPEPQTRALAETAAQFWSRRSELLAFANTLSSPEEREEVRRDLLELSLSLNEILRRQLSTEASPATPQDPGIVLVEAEELLGENPALAYVVAAWSSASPTPISQRELISKLAREGSAFDCSMVGRDLLHAAEYVDANLLLERATRLQPNDFWSWFWKGLNDYRRADYASSREALTVAIALRPNVAECYYNRGLAYLATENWSASIADFDQALALDPALAKALFNRGVVRLKQKQFQSAESDLLHAMRLGADPARSHYNLALVYWGLEDPQRAESQVTLALKARPDFTEAIEFLKRIKDSRSSAR
ncbi:MAG: tetratricopeptide repeat protein [Planctomycetota bacterium]